MATGRGPKLFPHRILATAAIALASLGAAQAAGAAWAEVTDPGGLIFLNERRVTVDFGLLLSGTANAPVPRNPAGPPETDGFFAVLDGEGEQVLYRRFDEDVRDEVVSAEARSGGGWLLLRQSHSASDPRARSVLHALNADGSDAWQRPFDSPEGLQFNEVFMAVSPAHGEIYLYESWGNYHDTQGTQRITRLSEDGDLVWQRLLPVSPSTRTRFEARLGTDRFVLVQRRYLSDGERDCVAIGFDTATGSTAWETSFANYADGFYCHGFHAHQGRIRVFLEQVTPTTDTARVVMIDAAGRVEALADHTLPFVNDIDRGLAITPSGRFLFLRSEALPLRSSRVLWLGGIEGDGRWMQWMRVFGDPADVPFAVLRANDHVWSLTTDLDDPDGGRRTTACFYRYDGEELGCEYMPPILIAAPNTTYASIAGQHLLVLRNAAFSIEVHRIPLPLFSDGLEASLLGQ